MLYEEKLLNLSPYYRGALLFYLTRGRMRYRNLLMRFNSLLILLLLCALASACGGSATPAPAISQAQASSDDELERRLKTISDTAQGTVGLSVVHIESGKTISINGQSQLPLYSVVKLPLAIVVLKEIEENRLRLDQKIHVTPTEIVPGTPGNTALWLKPVDVTIEQLIEYSISRSDNTSAEKLLQLTGGPVKVTDRMRALGFQHVDIRSAVAEYVKTRQNPNVGSAEDLANLLVQLHQGKILQSDHTALLIGFMQRANTGLHRLRGDLPSSANVADKTGSGETDDATGVARSTNDVGIITLPANRGHLAIAVLINKSTLPDAAQEKVIADLARAAYDAYAIR